MNLREGQYSCGFLGMEKCDDKDQDFDIYVKIVKNEEDLFLKTYYTPGNPCRFQRSQSSNLCYSHITNLLEKKYEKYEIQANNIENVRCDDHIDNKLEVCEDQTYLCYIKPDIYIPHISKFPRDVRNTLTIIQYLEIEILAYLAKLRQMFKYNGKKIHECMCQVLHDKKTSCNVYKQAINFIERLKNYKQELIKVTSDRSFKIMSNEIEQQLLDYLKEIKRWTYLDAKNLEMIVYEFQDVRKFTPVQSGKTFELYLRNEMVEHVENLMGASTFLDSSKLNGDKTQIENECFDFINKMLYNAKLIEDHQPSDKFICLEKTEQKKEIENSFKRSINDKNSKIAHLSRGETFNTPHKSNIGAGSLKTIENWNEFRPKELSSNKQCYRVPDFPFTPLFFSVLFISCIIGLLCRRKH